MFRMLHSLIQNGQVLVGRKQNPVRLINRCRVKVKKMSIWKWLNR